MTFDPTASAREKTPFGNFQLKPTHLKTGTVVCRYSDPEEFVFDGDLHAARMVVAGHSMNAADAAYLLDMLGIR